MEAAGGGGVRGAGGIGATVDNERSETPGELNTGDRGGEGWRGEKERAKVSKLIRTPSLLAVTMWRFPRIACLLSWRSPAADYLRCGTNLKVLRMIKLRKISSTFVQEISYRAQIATKCLSIVFPFWTFYFPLSFSFVLHWSLASKLKI